MQARKPRKAKLPVPLERLEQMAYVSWFYLAYPGKRLAKFNNEGTRSALQTHRLIKEGLLPGVPDIVILVPRKPHHGLYIEFKRRKGGVVSPAQREVINYLNFEGMLAIVACGWDDAREATIKYMNGEKW